MASARKVPCFPPLADPGAGAAPADVKPGAFFFQLCGSPIRTDVQHTFEDDEPDERRAPMTPKTPPLGSLVRPFTQLAVSKSPRREVDDQEEEKGTAAPAVVTDCDEQDGTRGDEENAATSAGARDQGEATVPRASPLSLAKAKEAGIPRFMSPWYESKADLPSSEGKGDARSPSHVSIAWSELQLGRILGEGAFGRVYTGRWKGKKVAVKILIRQNLSDAVVREFEKEVKIMSYLHHPNICALLGACLEPARRALVIELMERGCLWNLLRSHRRELSRELRGQMVVDIARGMQYLHSFERPILHRDMKSPNLLVEKDFSIKIADFGLARVKAQIQTMTGNCGTVQWMAPEVLGNRKYTEKADVFSFGVVVWEIFTGRCPYDGMTQIQAALSVLNHDLRPSIPASCPKFFARLMKMCWARNPEERPSFDLIVRLYDLQVRAKEEAKATKVAPKVRVWKP